MNNEKHRNQTQKHKHTNTNISDINYGQLQLTQRSLAALNKCQIH